MAMTEPLANHQQYLHDSVALAGPSTAPPPAAIDDLRKPSCSSSQPSTAAAKNNGPTPPSSPSHHAAADQQSSGQSSLTGTAPNQADRLGSPLVTPSPIQQQPTPPSTLPQNAAFPQAASEDTMDLDTMTEVVGNDADAYAGERHHASSADPAIEPPYVGEPEDQETADDDGRPRSPESNRYSSSPSTLGDDVPVLDTNEAAYILETDMMDHTGQDAHSGGSLTDPLLNPPAGSNSSGASRPPSVPRAPSNSSRHSSRSNLPNLQGSLQIPQQQPQTHLYQPGAPYPYLIPSEPRLGERVRPGRDPRVPLSPEVPPWQPDSEVNNCPICRAGFTFFYRKHHCRKCGRVVCAPCSPHRIVIPKSFVVYPPNTLEAEILSQTFIDPAGNRRHSYVGGDTGVEVRICNNCLAGENTASATRTQVSANNQQPMQSPAGGAGRFWQNPGPSPGGNASAYISAQTVNLMVNPNAPRRRTVSSMNPLTQPSGHSSGVGFPGIVYHHQQYGQAHSLGRSPVHGFFPGQQHPPYHSHPGQQPHQPPLQHPSPLYPQQHPGHQAFPFAPPQFYPSPQPQPSQYHHQHQGHQRSASSSSPHAYNQYSPVNQPIRGLIDTSQQPIPAFSMPDTSRPHLPIASQFIQSGSRESQTHSAPPQPQPRLKETDYCPICTAVLPPPNPITKDESAREAHIQQCIDNAVSGNDVPHRRSASGSLTLSATMTTQPQSAPTAEGLLALNAASALVAPVPSSSTPYERARRHTASARTSGGRMVVYTATEKDTFALGNDAEAEGQKAECVICFEEFEAGDSIARLECFCRYHKKCIQDWFNRRGDGQCPVHAMNE
ncbi:hypothetical protein TWF696_009722 [Orbilia brochopaga]|uniref:RING-type E3 ubiquitin transferase n=1 Tax=Orbilia brochopaga TaxID=3140254 RepID=A0AAV9UEG7_9PEZI